MNSKMLIVYYLLEIIILSVMIINIKKISRAEIKNNFLNYIIMCIICGVALINNLYNITFFKSIIALVLILLLIKIFFRIEIQEATFYALLYSLMSLVLELLLSPIILFNFKNVNELNTNIQLKVIFTLVNCIILIFIFSTKIVLKYIYKINVVTKKHINMNNIMFVVILFLSIIGTIRAVETNNNLLIAISLIFVIFILFALRITTIDKYNIKLLEEKNECLNNSFRAYSETIDECRKLKHNLKNELHTLNTTIPKRYQKNVNLIISKYNKNYEWINKIHEIPKGLQGMIYLKSTEAKEFGIKLIINTENNINSTDINYLDLCNIIGILLDNAIEAVKSVEEKNIFLDIVIDKKENKINIYNHFNNKINLNKIGTKNYSTKQIKSGIGINYIKNLNNKIKINFKIIDDLFISQVRIRK